MDEDQRNRLQRLAFYSCTMYALVIAALLYWRIDESALSLGYDPNERFRAIRIGFLLLLSGLSGYAAGLVNRYSQARYDRTCEKYGIERVSLSAIRWAQMAGIVLICSVLLIAR